MPDYVIERDFAITEDGVLFDKVVFKAKTETDPDPDPDPK